MYFKKHHHRNQTNRNIIIIAIGFLATVLAGTFVFQMYMGTIRTSSNATISVTIDNTAVKSQANYTISILDTSISRKLPPYSEQFTVYGNKNTRIPIHVTLSDIIVLRDTMYVRDSLAYIFLVVDTSVTGAILPRLIVSK